MANKKKLREKYRKRFHSDEKADAVESSSDSKDDHPNILDKSPEGKEMFSRAESPPIKSIDIRQDFKRNSKQKPKKKFKTVKHYKKRDESIRNNRIKNNSKNKRTAAYNKSKQSNIRQETFSNETGNSVEPIEAKIRVNKSRNDSTNIISGKKLNKDNVFSKQKDKTKNNKFAQNNDKSQKIPKKLIESQSRRSKLKYTAKNISSTTHLVTRKFDQFETQKESDENSAIMATDEGAEILSKSVQNSVHKKYSKLKFKGSTKEKITTIQDAKDSLRKTTKKNSVNNYKTRQKKNIKKKYSADNRVTYDGVKERFRSIIKKAKEWATSGLKKIGIYMIGPIFLFVVSAVMILSFVQSFSSGVGTIASTSYQSDDVEITNSHLIYTGLEADLKHAIENVESDHSGYDEYKYSIDSIGHDMHLLMAYLTAKYDDFTSSEVRSELNSIFNDQYDYDLTSVTETRYKTVRKTRTDPETGERRTTYKTVAYDWHVLKVSLDTNDLESILISNLDDEEKEFYDALIETKGNFMYLPSPFNESWVNSVSSYFGYRLDPISNKVTFHAGIDIAKPTGTELLSIIEGEVIKVGYSANGYGHYIIVKDKNEQTILYGHCSSIIANEGDEVEAGQVIALVGSSGKSTGPHVHLEIRDSSGNKLNPYFYLTQD